MLSDAAFADGWCLDAVQPLAHWAGDVAVLRATSGAVAAGWQIVPRIERELALSVLVEVARADGLVNAAERKRLETVASKWSLPKEVLDRALERGASVSAAALTLPKALAELLVDEMIELLFADGRADVGERRLVERFAGSLGLQAEARARMASRLDELLKSRLAKRPAR